MRGRGRGVSTGGDSYLQGRVGLFTGGREVIYREGGGG